MASPAWVPVIGGKVLPPCELVRHLITDRVVPTSGDLLQRSWSRSALVESLAPYGELEDSVWECVVALWRLGCVEVAGSGDEVWRKHVSAWLVSRGRCPLVECSWPSPDVAPLSRPPLEDIFETTSNHPELR